MGSQGVLTAYHQEGVWWFQAVLSRRHRTEKPFAQSMVNWCLPVDTFWSGPGRGWLLRSGRSLPRVWRSHIPSWGFVVLGGSAHLGDPRGSFPKGWPRPHHLSTQFLAHPAASDTPLAGARVSVVAPQLAGGTYRRRG
uniref:Uncharacterized protein n=1 Tax=Vitis vinifera TaxID=29760 RepID=A5BTK3_VITVI|nr:hypothetical protein VITISV_010214 [Vitis vinifera]